MDRNYEDLIQAIAVQAARDYRTALKSLIRNPRDSEAKIHKDEIEVFFAHSGSATSLRQTESSLFRHYNRRYRFNDIKGVFQAGVQA